MTWSVRLEAMTQTEEQAKKLLSDLEEVVGKHNAELDDSEIEED